jgi:hypothetical protein
MFDIDGDAILFENMEVARFTRAAYPSLRDRIEGELIAHVVDGISEEDHAAAIAAVHEEYSDCVNAVTHDRLQDQFDELQDKYDQLQTDLGAVRSELVKENAELCRQRDKLAAQVLVMKRKLKEER